MRTAIVAVLVACLAALAPDMATAQTRAQQLGEVASMCADCHGGVDASKLKALTHADSISCLTCHHIGFTNDPALARTRREAACRGCHEDLPGTHVDVGDPHAPECTSCHSIHSDPPDPEEAARQISARCTECHTMEHPLHANVGANKPLCTDCHTSHSGKSFDARDHDVVGGCLDCHKDAHPTHDDVEGVLECTRCHTEEERPASAAMRMSSEAQCSNCHGDLTPAHADVREGRVECLACHDFKGDVPVQMAGEEMSERCASCHPDAMKGVLTGGHARFLTDEDAAALRNCLTCHVTHANWSEEKEQLRRRATERCIACHSEGMTITKYGLPETVTESYTDDFHGQTMEFLTHAKKGEAYPEVLVCADCHGAHDVGWTESDVVANVCLRCHEDGDERLAGAWLGHDPVGPHNQALIWLVRMFYYFLIPFMLGGLLLNIVFNLVDQRRKGARIMESAGLKRLLARLRKQHVPAAETVTRFSVRDRWEHFGTMATFLILVVTGLPQTRPDLGVARAIIEFLGGIGTTRIIHRTAGFLFLALLLSHVVSAVARSVRDRRLPAMVPTRKDFEDILQTFRHYLLGERLPRVGKFDFSEKFEYWGLFLGGIVMSATGLVLMFPELVTQVVPGVVVAAARVMHGLEATFAVLVVVLWHSYGVIFRPEIFPLDTAIFTGKMSVARLKHEHPLEYERLFPERAAAEPHEEQEEHTTGLLKSAPEGLAGD